LDRRSRNVFILLSGDFECLALKKSLDLSDGKLIFTHPHILAFGRFLGLDFELVD